ncbi:MAG: hypothetical protein NTX50_21740 [Candidatus Sumerlaeota bacterium]|nr:hypothetical protein [Candidatus Sumerlaeota bacterium]
MSIEFDINWEDPGGVSGPELRATWARFSVTVDGQPVTRFYDTAAQTRRDYIYCSLYTVCEWIAANWFFIFYEASVPFKSRTDGFYQRHCLRHAGEDSALPELWFLSEGTRVCLKWRPYASSLRRAEYMGQGTAWTPADDLRRSLSGLVNTVLARLAAIMPDERWWLQEEWQAIQELSAEEREFAAYMARLGKYPFAIGPQEADRLISLYQMAPASLADEFVAAIRFESLETDMVWLRSRLDEITSFAAPCEAMTALREIVQPVADSTTPWRAGYGCARRLREVLGYGTAPLQESVLLPLGFGNGMIRVAGAPEGICALAAERNGAYGYFIREGMIESRRFAFSRIFFELLVSPHDTARLASHTRSETQQRNRAFAAEWLAPAQGIRSLIKSDMVTTDAIAEIAAHFQVSPYVIEHQVENHQIATIMRSEGPIADIF